MPVGEFDLIAQQLTALGASRTDVILGVGDDAAIVEPAPGSELHCACACVMLAARPDQTLTQPVETALQDLIVMLQAAGFTPAWATLVLTLPSCDVTFVHSIAAAVHRTCLAHGIAVIGGDTTAGAASLTIFLTGLRRDA